MNLLFLNLTAVMSPSKKLCFQGFVLVWIWDSFGPENTKVGWDEKWWNLCSLQQLSLSLTGRFHLALGILLGGAGSSLAWFRPVLSVTVCEWFCIWLEPFDPVILQDAGFELSENHRVKCLCQEKQFHGIGLFFFHFSWQRSQHKTKTLPTVKTASSKSLPVVHRSMLTFLCWIVLIFHSCNQY